MLLAAQAATPELTAQDWNDALQKHMTVCTRLDTAIDGVIRGIVPAERVVSVQTGGFTSDLIAGADRIRDGTCSGFVQPLWMAQEALASAANPSDVCDLRITYPVIEAASGGYVIAQGWRRDKHMIDFNASRADSAASGDHADVTCNDFLKDAITFQLKQMQQANLNSLRSQQRARLRTNQCADDGSFATAQGGSNDLHSPIEITELGGLIIVVVVSVRCENML